jgi:hypothetical protein
LNDRVIVFEEEEIMKNSKVPFRWNMKIRELNLKGFSKSSRTGLHLLSDLAETFFFCVVEAFLKPGILPILFDFVSHQTLFVKPS